MRSILSLLILSALALPALANGYGQQVVQPVYAQPIVQRQMIYAQPIVQRQRVYAQPVIQRQVVPYYQQQIVQPVVNPYCQQPIVQPVYGQPVIQQNIYPQRRGLIRRIMGY